MSLIFADQRRIQASLGNQTEQLSPLPCVGVPLRCGFTVTRVHHALHTADRAQAAFGSLVLADDDHR